MKNLQRLAGGLAGLSLILILLITAIEIAAYSDYSYYEREYSRLGVLNTVPMEMDDLMDVTKEMMSYLRGGRKDLQVITTIGGEEMEFFNEQEKVHMEDCRNLFTGAILLRRICLAVLLLSIAFLLYGGMKDPSGSWLSVLSRTLPGTFQRLSLAVLGLSLVLAILFASDFTSCFTVFHQIFFRNDLWLFDPAVSRLINIVPEPFWVDTGTRCLLLFIGLMLLVTMAFSLWKRIAERKNIFPGTALSLAVILAVSTCLSASVQVQALGVPQELAASIAASSASPADSLPAPVDLSGSPDWPEAPSVDSEAAILMESKTGKILYSKNANEAYFPASITKLMTALLTLERCQLSDIVTFSYRATHELEQGSTHIARTEGEEMSVRDCLYALLLFSANEVAQALAEHISGSFEDFAVLMNERAVQLGCSNTHFVNPSGLNNSRHLTTCRDMALILRACTKIPEFLEIESANSYVIPPTNRHEESTTVVQKHKLVKQGEDHYEGALAGKTGYTTIAGNTLATYAVRGDMELICIIMKSMSTHYADTRALLDWGFDNFSMVQLSSAEEPARLNANLPEGLLISEDEWLILPRGLEFSALDVQVDQLNGTVDANGNRPAGRVHYLHSGTEYGTATLLLPTSAEEEPTTAAETVVEETPAVTETKAARGGLQKVREAIRNIPLPSQESVIRVLAVAVDHWPITLGILAGLLILVILLTHFRHNEKRRKKRNYRYGGYTTTRRTRKRPNKYTMRKE